jgi:transcriptional regulator with XRE-family HTH domain
MSLAMHQNTRESFDDFFADAEKRDTYWEELAILEFTEALVARLKSLSLSKSEWAKRLGIGPSQVTKLLAGENNFTLRTMVKLARSLGCELAADLRQEGDSAQSYVAYNSGSVIVPFVSFARSEQAAFQLSGQLALEKNENSPLAA